MQRYSTRRTFTNMRFRSLPFYKHSFVWVIGGHQHQTGPRLNRIQNARNGVLRKIGVSAADVSRAEKPIVNIVHPKSATFRWARTECEWPDGSRKNSSCTTRIGPLWSTRSGLQRRGKQWVGLSHDSWTRADKVDSWDIATAHT